MMDLVNTKKLILIYLILVNITGFAMMGIDKKRAKRGAWRIPEKTLFLASALVFCGGDAFDFACTDNFKDDCLRIN